jgi:hypothetical protein
MLVIFVILVLQAQGGANGVGNLQMFCYTAANKRHKLGTYLCILGYKPVSYNDMYHMTLTHLARRQTHSSAVLYEEHVLDTCQWPCRVFLELHL